MGFSSLLLSICSAKDPPRSSGGAVAHAQSCLRTRLVAHGRLAPCSGQHPGASQLQTPPHNAAALRQAAGPGLSSVTSGAPPVAWGATLAQSAGPEEEGPDSRAITLVAGSPRRTHGVVCVQGCPRGDHRWAYGAQGETPGGWVGGLGVSRASTPHPSPNPLFPAAALTGDWILTPSHLGREPGREPLVFLSPASELFTSYSENLGPTKWWNNNPAFWKESNFKAQTPCESLHSASLAK